MRPWFWGGCQNCGATTESACNCGPNVCTDCDSTTPEVQVGPQPTDRICPTCVTMWMAWMRGSGPRPPRTVYL